MQASYVPGAEYDVFISYAHIDNEAASDQEGWVSRFVADLRRALRRQIGLASNQGVNIFFDEDSVGSNHKLSMLKEKASNSAAFVAIISPSYVIRDWTRDELAAFSAPADATGRIFAVESMPLERQEDYPETFRDLIRQPFWRRKEGTNHGYPLAASDKAWDRKVQDVARDIKLKLRELRDAGGIRPRGTGIPAPVASVTIIDPKRMVLLAQVTDDLEEDRDQVRRYLEQYGVGILPTGTYPQGGSAFSEALEADLGKANFFVQLVSRIGRCPPDLAPGYPRFQYQAAVQQAAKRPDLQVLLWRRPDLDVPSLRPDDRALLSGGEVLAMGLESFKAEIVRRIKQVNAPKPPGRGPMLQGEVNVFINADREDIEFARVVQKDFERNGCTAMLPLYEGDASDLRDDLEEKIIWCNALALVYGRVKPRWISSQAMTYCKLKPKRSEPALVLICRDAVQPKPDHGIAMPELREIDYGMGPQHDPIKELLSELRQ
jgi:hypothetical protein